MLLLEWKVKLREFDGFKVINEDTTFFLEKKIERDMKIKEPFF